MFFSKNRRQMSIQIFNNQFYFAFSFFSYLRGYFLPLRINNFFLEKRNTSYKYSLFISNIKKIININYNNICETLKNTK